MWNKIWQWGVMFVALIAVLFDRSIPWNDPHKNK